MPLFGGIILVGHVRANPCTELVYGAVCIQTVEDISSFRAVSVRQTQNPKLRFSKCDFWPMGLRCSAAVGARNSAQGERIITT